LWHTSHAEQLAACSISDKISDTVDRLLKAFKDRPVVSEIVSPDVKTGSTASAPATMLENRILTDERMNERVRSIYSTKSRKEPQLNYSL
jgi:hypothetical protein